MTGSNRTRRRAAQRRALAEKHRKLRAAGPVKPKEKAR